MLLVAKIGIAQSVSNIIALKNANVSENVIVEYIKSQSQSNKTHIVTNAVTVVQPKVVTVDPESYTFFYSEHLHPRMVALRYRQYPELRHVPIMRPSATIVIRTR